MLVAVSKILPDLVKYAHFRHHQSVTNDDKKYLVELSIGGVHERTLWQIKG